MKIHCSGLLQLKNDGAFDVLFVIYDSDHPATFLRKKAQGAQNTKT